MGFEVFSKVDCFLNGVLAVYFIEQKLHLFDFEIFLKIFSDFEVLIFLGLVDNQS